MKPIILVFFTFLFVSCETQKEQQSLQNWHGSMRGLANSLTEVMPDLITEPRRLSPMREKKMRLVLKDLEEYADSLTEENMVIPSRDPSLPYVARGFRTQLMKVRENSKRGDSLQLQLGLRDLTKYCVACHTRTPSASSAFVESMESGARSLSAIQKAQFYTSMRLYEKALVHYEKALTNKNWAQKNKKLWNDSVIQMLAITVRVHNNPNLTLELISQLFDTKAYPRELVKAARVWRKDALAWNKMSSKDADLQGITPLLKKANQQDKKIRHSGLILNLRALAKLNQYLQQGGLKSRSEQVVLYYTGLITERLQDLDFSGFPKSYYLACVDQNPSSRVAKSCQKRLSQL
jgi:hypothetical protein